MLPHLLFIAVLSLLITTSAAHPAESEPPSLPFTLERGRVVVPTSVNGSEPLRLTLDTGMGFDGVYLYHRDALNLIDTTGAIEVRVPGAGGGEPSHAMMIETGRIAFGGVTVSGQRIIVSQSEYTQSFQGDGVFGWNLFGHYIVELDYDRLLITLHDTTYVHSDSSWRRMPIEMRNNLPFFEITVEVIAGEIVPLLVYIDLAAEDALELLTRPDQKFSLPDSLHETYLGTGLSGDIYGHTGRSRRVRIGNYDLYDIRTAFAPAEIRSKQEGADGILGSSFLRHFNIIFDYPHDCLFIKPNNTFELPFD